ncbi:PREDICTED: hemK methyltransferase family member 1 isoform X2 [Crocodylus porosus]|uniref:hemK methyltransferase family member 1 isoform X2 n=1 Tax=Crocodylus porosus TaxID=8502 RepID=UPI00093FD44F|nr:PREDICTED: hemK methyltransferase family member 1 isoform X2 [Crocodylus porosus]
MKLLISPLQRMIMGLLPPWGPVGINPIKSAALNAHQFLLRQNFSGKPGLVTAIDLVNYWQEVFEANRIPEAQESSEYIVSYVLGAKTFHSLSASSISTPLTAEQQEQVQQLSAKRLQRMPVQYVLGEWDFQDLTLKMRPPVFIPRPETESQVIAVDKEVAAVNLTRENAQRFQLQHRLRLFHHDVSSSSREELLPWGPVDIIVSNPPYVFHEDMAHLAAEILRYENLDALDGGNDGMRVIKRILELAPCILKNYGSVFLEVDPRHPEMVENWLQSRPDLFLSLCATHKDFCGKPRFLHIQKTYSR